MAMAMTEAHERRWINTTWELQQQQNPENPENPRDGEAGAGGDHGSALLSSRVDWELKDWESINLAYPTSDENCCSSSSLPETVMVSAAAVKSEPQAEVEESEEEEEEEEEEVVHQAPEAAAPLKLGLKLGRRSSSSSSTEKNMKEKAVSQGSCSTATPTAVIAPPPAAVAVAVAAGSSSSPPSTKKQRVTSPSSAAGGGGGNQNPAPPPRCQVEGCTADLSSAKDYHRRHKVCEMHSKASKAIAAGREQRFCQQCSRFHVLTEFDEIKRSCRRRLAGHNERRRKPHSESTSAAAAAAAAAAINLSFNCRISSPMHSTDAFRIHGTAADSLTLDDCKQTQFLEQIQGSQGGGRPLSSPDLHDDDEHSNHHHPFANVLNLSSPWRPGENVRSPQHIQQVEEKEGQLIMLDRRYCAPSSNRLLMFLQSPRGQMRGALDPSPDVGLSNLSPLVVGGGGSSQEFVDGAKGSLCQNLSLGGGSGWENDHHHNYHHNQGCESQSSGCALSLLSWGTTPCPPALDLCVDNTSLDHHHHQLVADNNMGSNTVASFATHHLPQQQSQEHYLAFEKLFSAQSGGLGGIGISDIKFTDIQQQQQPLEQSQLHGVGGGGGGDDDGASGNFLSYLGGLGLDAGNSMLALFQSSHDLQGMRSGVSSAHQSLKVTSDLVRTPSLQVHQQHHLHQVHTTTTSVHSQMQTSFNGGGGEYREFGPSLCACESSLFSTQHML